MQLLKTQVSLVVNNDFFNLTWISWILNIDTRILMFLERKPIFFLIYHATIIISKFPKIYPGKRGILIFYLFPIFDDFLFPFGSFKITQLISNSTCRQNHVSLKFEPMLCTIKIGLKKIIL